MTEDRKVGGFGVVYSGIRKEDNFPIAIKRVQSWRITRTEVILNGKRTLVPMEVALLIRVGDLIEDNSVTPVLLDWFDLGSEVVLVLERPDPCMDMVDYINSLEDFMNEHEAKVIFRQLVDAALRMRALGIFHRDIKPDNILIETGHSRPRARFIDFGCGTTCALREVFKTTQGTESYTPPEFFLNSRVMADTTTVWQLGLSLYCMLNNRRAFVSVETICSSYQPPIRAEISDDGKDFIRRMLDKNPETRISIDSLKEHPWMN